MLNDNESAYLAGILSGLGHQLMADLSLAHTCPSAVFRPALRIDGNQWCALYGADLQDGVAGFGDSPELAMQDFNREWNKKLATKQGGQDE